MVRSKYFLAAALAVAAGLSVFSCTQEEAAKEVKVGFESTDAQFSQDGKAILNLAVSPAASAQVSVIIAAGSEAQDGFTAVPATALSFGSSVTVAAGTETVPVEVSVDLDAVEDGQQAVITIVAASGATVDDAKATAYIKVVKSDENNPVDNPEDEFEAPVEGTSEWSVVGSLLGKKWDTDFVCAEEDGAFVLKNVDLKKGDEIKFRKDKGWDVNRGINEVDKPAELAVGTPAKAIQDGGNIIIPEDGIYDLYYFAEKEAIVYVAKDAQLPEIPDFTEGDDPGEGGEGIGTLDWTVKYNGRQWVDGYYTYGQMDVFEVSNTDVSMYYYPALKDVEQYDIAAALAEDSEAFFADLQASLDKTIEYYAGLGYTAEEVVARVCYNEVNDGQFLKTQLSIGTYQFAVFSLSADGKFDGKYKVIEVTSDSYPDYYFDWGINLNLRSDWGAEWDGWKYEGEEYWVSGTAPGATYVVVDSYTAEELDYYHDGSVDNLFSYTQSSIHDLIWDGYFTMEDLAEYGLIYEVDDDGSFAATVYTQYLTGETNVYVIGLDADGKVLNDYGVSVVDVPEVEPIDWQERTDWKVNYMEENPEGITATVCDAEYFVIEVYPEGAYESWFVDLDDLASDALYWVGAYGLEYCLEAGLAFDHVPAVYTFENAYYGIKNGSQIFMFGVDEYGKVTGEYHTEFVEGVPETEFTLVPEWSVTPVGEPYIVVDEEEEEYLMVDVEVDAPGIQYHFIEENTEDDLDYWYYGSVKKLAEAYEYFWTAYLSYGYSWDEIMEDYPNLGSPDTPASSMILYNSGLESTIYLIEYDEDGYATGRYGATTLTLPDYEWQDDDDIYAVGKASVKSAAVAKKLAKHTAGRNVKKMVRKDKSEATFKGVPARHVKSNVQKPAGLTLRKSEKAPKDFTVGIKTLHR